MLSLFLIFIPILSYSQTILPPSKASSSILSSFPSSSSSSSSFTCSHLAFCSSHGHCINNQCFCDQGWGYFDCSIRLNPSFSQKNLHSFRFTSILDKNSSLDNEILNSTDTSFTSRTSLEDTSIIKEDIILKNSVIPTSKCPFCENQGICDSLTGKCICLEPFTGPNCSLLIFPLPISVPPPPPSPSCFCLYGTCINDICHCIPTYTGPHCTQLTCPSSCSSHGYCSPSFVCICDPGYTGEDCSDILSQFSSSPLPSSSSSFSSSPSSYSSSSTSSSLLPSSSKNSTSNVINAILPHNSSNSSSFSSSSSSFMLSSSSSSSLLFLLPPSYLPCGPHGSHENNACVCETGWEGSKCEFLQCEGGCSSHGLCINGTCYCKHPYTGKNCQTKLISQIPSSSPLSSSSLSPSSSPSSFSSSIPHPLPSSLLPSSSPSSSLPFLSSSLPPPLLFSLPPPPLCQGLFINSTCFCSEGWTGSDCTIKTCPNACSFRGTCSKNGSCTCQRGYRGEDCAEKYIKNGYFTKKGTVKCIPPYSGSFCSRKNCEPKCKNGKCVNGTCRCEKGWIGVSCEEKDCGACLNGKCENDICVCKKGWKGNDCSEKLCVKDCSNHGICENDGRCACNLGYTGLACEVSIFNLTCSYHGVFRESACICEEGWLGEFCNEKKNGQTEVEFCPKNCSQNGACSGPPLYECICNLGFIGETCDIKIDNEKLECEKGCNEHGKCLMNKCICDSNFKGVGCEKEIFSVNEIQCRSKCVKTCLEKEKFHECLSFCNLNCDKQEN